MPSDQSPEEKYLIDQLRTLQEQYFVAAKPFVDRLAALRNAAQPRYYIELEPGDSTFVPGSFLQ